MARYIYRYRDQWGQWHSLKGGTLRRAKAAAKRATGGLGWKVSVESERTGEVLRTVGVQQNGLAFER